MEQVFTNLTNGGPVSVYVKDGVITSIRPLQIPEEDYPKAWSIEAGGKSYSPPKALRCSPATHAERDRFYSKNRILYPMKRVDWDPKGERNPQNRGKSDYVRISWDEALDLVSGEMKRLIDTHGGHAVTGITSSHHNWGVVGYKMGPFARFMNMLHFTPILDNPDSWEGWHWGATHTYGFYWRLGMPEPFDLLSDALQNSEMFVCWSADPDSTRGTYSGQESAIWRTWLKEQGKKVYVIDPYYNYTAAAMDGIWLPVKPGGDTALAMAIAFVWIDEGTYDKEYLAEKTVGFDEFSSYVRGKKDGVAKTPEWAEEKCGIPARRIRGLARDWAKHKTSLNCGSRGGEGGACRTAYGTEWARMMVLLQAMQGLGKPGVSIWGMTMGCPSEYTWFPAYAEPRGQMGKADVAKQKLSLMNPTKQRLYRLTLPDAVMAGEGDFNGVGFCGQSLEQQFIPQHYPTEGEVKMFYRYGGSFIGTMSDTNKWVQMYQSDKLECVVNQDCWYGGEARFADVILPACTNLEREDIGEWAACGGYTTNSQCGCNWRTIIREQKCAEPLGESRSDYEILSALADRLGMKETYTEGNTELDWCRLYFESSEVAKKGMITWEEFNRKGYLIIPVPEDYKARPGMRWYAEGRMCDTPDASNPDLGTERSAGLGTDSGKIEFVSESLKRLAPKDDERPLSPEYIPSWEGAESGELFEKYPLQLISPHPRFSFHTHYDNHTAWLDEIPGHRVIKDGYAYWPVRLNPEDAAERSINGGAVVELYNDRGSVLGIAVVTHRVPRGVVHSYGCSAKYDPVMPVPGATDRAGCVNLLTSSRMLSKYCPGMTPNTCLCEVRLWDA
ncbi:MAG: molybdopterin-dependent oxidoreductase [Oscillospiraceae bacterium]|nr:molybdopterin-dependent oxidoreductase [Oscillospiraceae bacterium]